MTGVQTCALPISPSLALKKGTYNVEVIYDTNQHGNFITVSSEGLLTDEGKYRYIPDLSPELHHFTLTFELLKDSDDVIISADFSGKGYLSIVNISLFETRARYNRLIIYYVFFVCFSCCLFILIRHFLNKNILSWYVFLSLAGIAVLSSLPLLNKGLLYGDDLYFHLLRIEGLRKGLSAGDFPVKIHPVWINDYGYAVGVFYADIALYFPAILRCFGFTVQSAYEIFICMVNMITVVISYFSFKRIFHNSSKIGILGCLIYSLAPYRLYDIYIRAAVGEFLAMMVFPLVFLSFYLVFMETNAHNWKKYSVITAISLTGVIQSHILSCEMLAFPLVVLCLIEIKKVFQKFVLKSLLSAGLLTIFLNIGFLVPFLDFYKKDIQIGSPLWTNSIGTSFEESVINFRQLMTLLPKELKSPFISNSFIENPGLGMSYIVGLFLLFLVLILKWKQCFREKNFKVMLFCTGTGLLFSYMATDLFPWSKLLQWGGNIAQKLLYSLQFSWRLLSLASILLAFSICFAVSILANENNKAGYRLSLCLLCFITFFTYGLSHQGICKNRITYNLYSVSQLNPMIIGEEYLPTETSVNDFEPGEVSFPEGIEVSDYEQNGTQIKCHVRMVDNTENAYVEFPLNFYRHYKCSVTNTKKTLSLSNGYNGRLRVNIPDGFDGDLQIVFKEPWFWRVSEIISILTCLYIFRYLYIQLRFRAAPLQKSVSGAPKEV